MKFQFYVLCLNFKMKLPIIKFKCKTIIFYVFLILKQVIKYVKY